MYVRTYVRVCWFLNMYLVFLLYGFIMMLVDNALRSALYKVSIKCYMPWCLAVLEPLSHSPGSAFVLLM